MRFIFAGIIVLVLIVAGAVYYLYPTLYGLKPDTTNTPLLNELPDPNLKGDKTASESSESSADIPQATIVAQGLDTPWAIAFLPSGDMLVTERKGSVSLVDKSGKVSEVVQISTVKEIGEGGLLGIALHPKYSENNLVYLYYTYSADGDNTQNRVVSMKYQNGTLSDEKILLDKIPGASNHNGGRIKFGPDNYLYITTGDAQEPSHAQDKMSDAGKILRINPETGEGVSGNLDKQSLPPSEINSQVYSYGHRNPQGIAWDKAGNLWETEHGPSGSGMGTGNDEVNLIEVGKNYGWPEIQGDQTRDGMVTPLKNSTPAVAWAPGDIAVVGDTLYFGGLRGQALYRAKIDNGRVRTVDELLKGSYGRIREVIVGPDNMLYITTSNRDGRGVAGANDDRIIRINPSKI